MKALFLLAIGAVCVSAQSPGDNYKLFLQGILTGLEPAINGSVARCLPATDAGFTAAANAITLFENGVQNQNISALIAAFAQLKTAISDLAGAAQACNEPALAADLRKLLAEDPISIVMKLLPYWSTVLSDIESTVSNWNNGQYLASGTSLGKVLGIVIAQGVSGKNRAVNAVQSPGDNYKLFLQGILTGLEPAINGSVARCLPATDSGFTAAANAITLFENGVQNQNISALIAAFAQLKTAISDLAGAAQACNEPALAADLRKLLAEDPISIVMKLLPYWSTVLSDIESTVSNWNNGQYLASGTSLGKVLGIVIAQGVSALAKSRLVNAAQPPYVQFLLGVLAGVEPNFTKTVGPCLKDNSAGFAAAQALVTMLEKGIASGNVSEIYAAFQQATVIITDLRQAAVDCNEPALAAALNRLLNKIATDPVGLLSSLMPYASTFARDIQGLIAAFGANQFNLAGQKLGNIIAIVLVTGTSKTVGATALSNYALFLNGVLSTLEPAIGGNVAPCIKDSDSGIEDATQAINLIGEGIRQQNYTKLRAALQYALSTVNDLKQAAIDCNELEFAKKLADLGEQIVSDPFGVILKLLPNASAILSDIEGASTALRNGQYLIAGADLGKVLVFIINA